MRRFLQSIITVLLVCGCILARAQTSQTINNGQQTQAVIFPGPGCAYNWTNDKPGIGLPASGTGNISSFTAINTGSTPIVANITAIPVLASYAYIANQGDGTITVIDVVSHQVIGTVDIGSSPVGVVASPDGKRIYAANNPINSVTVINTADNSKVTDITVGQYPYAIAVSPDSRWVYVGNESDASISVIDAQTNTVFATIHNVEAAISIVVSPDGKWVYAATESGSNAQVYIINALTNTVDSSIPIPYPQNEGMVVTPDGKTLYMTSYLNSAVTVVNLVTKVVSTIDVNLRPDISPFASGPYGIAINSTGTRVYVICSYQNVIAVINTANNAVIKTIHVNGGEIFNVAISNDDKELYVINRNANEVEVFNTANYTRIATVTGASFNSPLSQGNFISKGPGCSGSTVSFTITVNPLVPTLTATTATGTISACVGMASASPNIQQFTVSGSDLTAGIKATAPGGFQVSLSANSGYGSSVLLSQSGGKVTDVVVYVRSAASATSSLTDNVVLTSAGAANQNVVVSRVINELLTVNPVTDKQYNKGDITSPIPFTGTANTFTWTNDNPGIGLPVSGTGDIQSFTAVNSGATPAVATIKVTPVPTSYAYIANQGTNKVAVINCVTHKVIKTFDVGSIPVGVVASADGRRIYTANNDASTVSVINTADNTVITSIPVANGPYGIAISPDGNRVYAASSNAAAITVIETQTNSVLTTIPNLPNVISIAVSPDGKWVYAASEGSPNAVYIINASTNVVDSTIPLGSSYNYSMVITPDGKNLYFTNNQNSSVTRVDLITKAVSSIPVGSNPYGIAVNSTGTRVYVACSQANEVDIINTATNAVIKTLPATGSPFTVSVSSDDKELYVTNRAANAIDVFGTGNYSKITTITGPAFDNPMSLGNFISKGLGCSGTPVIFTITVNAATAQLTATAVTGTISACIGSPSASPNIQQFKVSGSNLSANIIVTAPTGFQVSLTAASGYGSNATLNQVGGVVSNKVIYVRSAASATGNISGNVVLQSMGAADKSIPVQGVINALPTVNAISNQAVLNGALTTVVNFTGTGNTFTWSNDQPSIGLAATGVGDIDSFTAINTGNSPVVATITATPLISGFAYIANSGSSNVSVINTETNLVVATIPVGTSPLGVTKNRDGSRAYVANGGSNNVSVINTLDNTVVATIPVGTAPQCLVVSADGNYVYVTNNISNTVSVISTVSNTVSAIPVGMNPASLCISPDGLHIYVVNNGDNTISVINTSLNSVEAVINPATVPMGIAISPDGGKVYITNYTQNTVSVISTATNGIIATINVGLNPWGISVSPDGTRVYVANTIDGTLSVIDATDNTAITAVNVGMYPWGVSVSPDGREAYVTNQFSNNVSVINTAVNTLKSTITVGTAPASIGDFITSGTVCSGLSTTFSITVNSAPPVITSINTPSAVNTTYGTASSSAMFNISGTNMQSGILVTPPPGFEVSTDNINFSGTITVGTIGTITSTPVYIRLKSTLPVGDYSGDILLTSKNAADVNVMMAISKVTPAALTITANNATKTYGTVLTGSAGSTAFTATGLQNGEKVGSVTIAYGTGAAANAAAGTYTGSVTASAATGGTFTAGNYTITFAPGDIIVSTATLTITANNATKTYGTLLTGSAGSTAFTATGLQNGEKVGSVTIAYGTGAAANAAAGTYTGSVTASAATGGTFTAGNYTFNFVPGDIIVSTATVTIIANNATKTYGTVLTGSAGSTAFTATGLQNGEKVGSVTIAYGTGAAANAAAGTYTGSVTASAATGGTFTAGNYTITFAPGDIIVSKATLTITADNATKTYGIVLTGSTGSIAFTATGLQNGENIGSVTIAYGPGSAANAATGTYTGSVTASAPTGGTFTAGNYTFNFVPGDIIVSSATLTITANNANKTYGTVLTGSAGSTAFTATGLQNGESVGSITIVYGTGAAATDPVNTYDGTVIPSAPTGGTFIPGNYIVVYINGNIIVNPAAALPVVTAGTVTGAITACAGSPSASPNIQQFTVSGTGLTNDITATAPANFEVSLSAGSGFGSSVTLKQSGGKIADVTVYIRSAVSARGAVSGNVTLASAGTANVTVVVNGMVNELPAVGAVGDKFYLNNDITAVISLTGTGNKYTWMNDNPSIGLAAGGEGDIASFTAVNTGTSPKKATITVIPQSKSFAYISNSSSNDVSVIDLFTRAVVKTIPVGSVPWGVATSPDGARVYVANNGSNSVSVINTATNSVITTVPVDNAPFGVAISPNGAFVYVANSAAATDKSISVINTATNMVTATVSGVPSPLGLTVSADGKWLYATNSAAPYGFYIINTATNTLAAKVVLSSNYNTGVCVNPAGTRAYVVNKNTNKITVINLATNTVETFIPVGGAPYGIALSPDGSRLYVTNADTRQVSVINTATNQSIITIPTSGSPYGVSVSGDGSELYVDNAFPGGLDVINTKSNSLIATISGIGDFPIAFGNFNTKGTGCTGTPTTFTITINALPPTITHGIIAGIITTCAGSPSASQNIQQFTISGSGLSGDITATAPTAFEVSLSAKTGFAKSVTLTPVNGGVTNVVVYVRSAISASAGPLSGNITLSSAGVANVTVGVSGVVNALPTVNQVSDQTKKDGEATDAVNFTGTGNKFRWTNDKPEIGLPVTGLGNIASFKARNAGGGEITATITVTPLRLGYAYIPDLQSNVVSVINLASNLVEATLPVGNNPIGVAVNAANNLVYVTNTGGSTVSVIDPAANNTVKGTIIVGNSPYGIKPNADGSLLFVANLNGGTVSVINTSTNTVAHTIDGFTDPIDVAVSADGGSLYVSNNRLTTVSVISTADYTIQKTITVGDAPYGLCFSPDGSRLYVANQASRDISVINTATNTVSNTIKGNFGPLYLGVSPDGSKLYVPNVSSTTVSVVNTTTNATVATIDGFGQPTGISFSPDGKYIYITNQSSNKLSVIDAATNTVVDNIPVAGDPVALGNFLLPGPGCDGSPVTFTIKVRGLAPELTHGAVTGSIIACTGSPSASPNIQQFTVSGTGLPGDITAEAPVGFEVSLSANSGFARKVTLTRTNGSVTNVVVYVRSADYAIGSVSGDVGLSCPGLPTQTVPVKAFINASTTVNTVPNQTKESGEATDPVTFSGTGSQFRWTNDKPEIGLPANGTGDIASFIAVNNGNSPVKANVTVTPISIGYAYIPNAQSNNVSIINLANNAVISTPEVGEDPYGVAVNKSNSSAYITNSGGNTVSVINTVTNTVSGVITVGKSPYGIKLNADGSLLYVANFGSNEISIISTATNSVLKTVGGFTAPADVAISPDGSMIYVSNTNANTVSVVRTSDYSIIKTIPVGTAPYMMGISPDGSKVYVANDGSKDISVIGTATNTVLAVIDGNFSSYGVGLSPDGNFLYVPNLSSDNISIINTATNEIIAVIGGFRGPTGISFSTDGRYYYVTNQLSNQLSIVNAQTNVILNNITVGNDPIAMGNFLLQGSACDGKPTTFTITVNQALPAAISTYGQLSPVNTIYGTPSPSSNFSVSGTSMKEGIKVTPPPAIEISTDNINFSNTLTVGAAGTIATTTIYVRLAKTTPVGSYEGFITLESSGASTISFILPACVVSPALLTVTANNKNKDYGTLLSSSSGSTDFTITGLQNSETAETISVVYNNGAAADAPVGNYPGSVTPSALAGGTFDPKNYSPVYLNGDIAINKVPLTITADNKSKSYKDPNPILTITYKGFVNNEGPAQLTTLPVMSTIADVTSLPGKYPISVSGATSPNYNITFVNGVLTISVMNLPLKIPNTFTPNGDGINDTWAIVNMDEYPDCTVNIFNRWGQNVFSSIGYGKLWDGSYKGALLPVSTYYYIIDLKNENKVYSGSITIIR